MWSYSGNPASSPKDAVRFYLGDTNTNSQLLSNEEIAFLLTQYPDPTAAAAAGAEGLAAFYTRFSDKSVGPLHVSYGARVKQFKDLAASLWVRAGGANFGVRPLMIYVGGLSIAEKFSRDQMPDLTQPKFRRNMFQPLDMPIENLRSEDEE